MGIFKKIKNRIVYSLTEKPKCYVHVDEPKNLQDLRQIQYNNWCKAKGVYSGSYLPKNPDVLTKRGWEDITVRKYQENKPQDRHLQRKSSKQIVRYESETNKQFAHYHWENRTSLKDKKSRNEFYKDRYGNICKRGSEESHLAPYDRDYIKKKEK